MNQNLDPRIKREFDALIYSVLDSEKLSDSIIRRLYERRMKFVFKIISALFILSLLISVTFYISNHDLLSKSTTITYRSEKSPAGMDMIQLPFSEVLSIDSSAAAKSSYAFKFKLTHGQTLRIWTHVPDRTFMIVGELNGSIMQSDGTFKVLQTYEIASGTNRQVFTSPADGTYQFRLLFSKKAFRSDVEVAFNLN